MLDRQPKAALSIKQTLEQWQTDAALAGVRDETALAGLPADEQSAWRQLWAEVGDLVSQLGKRAVTHAAKRGFARACLVMPCSL